MNANKLTQKTIEAVQNAQSICIDYQNQNVALEHLVYSLLNQEDGLIPSLLDKLGAGSSCCTHDAIVAFKCISSTSYQRYFILYR